MRVDITPRQAAIVPGHQQPIAITITNTSTVIGGYAVRVLGADPGWVALDAEQVSLFPDETRTVMATITPPQGIPAGTRRIAVQVRELTPPEASTIVELDLTVPAAKAVQLRLDPLAVSAGKRATFSLILENTGNTIVAGHLAGDDPEGKVAFRFEPETVSLSPGEHAVVDMRASARRHITGAPTVRVLGLYLDEPTPDGFLSGVDYDRTPARGEREALANGTFIQRSMLSRGPLSLLGLLAAVTVFALVITLALSRLVNQTTADRNLALQVAAARDAAAATGTSGVSGTVTLLTSGKGAPGVSVSVFTAADTSTPVLTTATDAKGGYTVGDLAAGKYKLFYRGAGFVQIWYPGAATDADATATSGSPLHLPAAVPGATPPPDNGSAIVKSIPVGADGTFSLVNVPSPSVYQLVVTKAGYATSTQSIDIGAGETRTGVQLTLSKGDGLISGIVSSATGALPGVTITATAGQSTASTVSLSGAKAGAFTLRGLPTPASFTVIASKPKFASQTLTLTLAAGQKLTGVAITLGTTSGKLRGMVTGQPLNLGLGGVSVTVTDGLLTVQSATQSQTDVGAWSVGGLPVPGTYTLTFARRDLASQTVSVSLDSAGNVTPGSQGASITAAGIAVSMQSSTATVYGRITQPGSACAGGALGEATVTLSSGSSSYTVTSASVPAAKCGAYRIEQLPPGTYTITVTAGGSTSPSSVVISLNAGDSLQKNVTLARPASMSGTVRLGSDEPKAGWTVFLYEAAQFPGLVSQSTRTSSTGGFAFTAISAGKYILATGPTSDPANATNTKQVTVQPSQQLTGVLIVVSQ
jgi:hypothetical protein